MAGTDVRERNGSEPNMPGACFNGRQLDVDAAAVVPQLQKPWNDEDGAYYPLRV